MASDRHRSMRAVRQMDWFNGVSRQLVSANEQHVRDLERAHQRGHGELKIRDQEDDRTIFRRSAQG